MYYTVRQLIVLCC